MKVYWSGAALALMADVTLRERSNGEQTLDKVLADFQACCLPAADVWSGPEFLSKLDEMLDEAVFMPLYRRHADTVGFPDTDSLLERLGVQISAGKVELRGDAELSAIRLAITRLDPQTARWRQQLVDNRT
jgi:predicted metalloprotease with PDZ domain